MSTDNEKSIGKPFSRGMSISQAANYIGASRNTIYRLGHKGLIPIRKIANRSIVLRDDLDRLLETAPSALKSAL